MIRKIFTCLTLLLSVVILNAQNQTITKTYYQNGLFKLKQNDLYGLATFEDSLIIPIQYNFISFVNDTVIKAENTLDKTGLITLNRDTIYPFELSKVENFNDGLAVAYKNGKFGMINPLGEEIIPFEYSYLSKYYDGLISFRKDATCGVMDVNQTVILPEGKFKFIREFRDGHAIASSIENSKFGIINKKGEWIVEPKYSDIYRQLIGGFKIVSKKQKAFKRFKESQTESVYGYINEKFELVLEPSFKNLTVLQNGNFYVSDSQAVIINVKSDTVYFHDGKSYYCGTSHVKIYNDSIGRYAILNQDGSLATDFEFETLSYYGEKILYGTKDGELVIMNNNAEEKGRIKEGRMIKMDDDVAIFSDNLKLFVYNFEEEKITKEIPYANVKSVHFKTPTEIFINQNNNYSIYDVASKTELHLRYDAITTPSDGLAPIELYLKKGIINLDGTEILSPSYYSVTSSSEGIFFAKKSYSDTTFAYDLNGNKLFPIESDVTYNPFSNGMILGSKNNSYHYLNKQGEKVFTSIYPCGDFKNGRAAFQKSIGKIGFYDKQGNEVIEAKYSEYGNFNSLGLAGVKDPNTQLWGFINKSGETVIAHQFEKIGDFINGYAMVSKDGKLGQIDKNGAIEVPIEYDEMKEFSDGYFAVKKDSLWGFINEKGKMKIPLQFEDVSVFKEGVCWVKLNGKLQLIDGKGQVKINAGYTNTNNFRNGIAVVVDANGKYGVINKNNDAILPFEYDYISQVDDNKLIIGYSENWSKVNLN